LCYTSLSRIYEGHTIIFQFHHLLRQRIHFRFRLLFVRFHKGPEQAPKRSYAAVDVNPAIIIEVAAESQQFVTDRL